MNERFYNSILSRISIRRFRQEKLDLLTHKKIETIFDLVKPLVEDNQFNVRMLDYGDQFSSRILGGFGMLMRPSHILVPYIVGTNHVLEDLGYRIQQIVLGIWHLGIGSCYLGCVHGQNNWKKNIPEIGDAQIIANVAIGYPSDGFESRIIKNIYDNFFNTGYRMPIESIYFQDSFNHPSAPSGDLAKVINAGRMSPSAVNAQPWRFLEKGNQIILYIKLNKSGRIFDRNQLYSYHDAGICMANMKLAAESLGLSIEWNLFKANEKTDSDNSMLLPISCFTKPKLKKT